MLKSLLDDLMDAWGKEDLRSTLIKGAGLVFIIRTCGAGLAYFSEVFIARLLGPQVYGEYTYALSWALILAIPAGLGFSTGVIRFIPEYITGKNRRLLKGIVINSWLATLGAGIVLTVICSVLLSAFSQQLSRGLTLALYVSLWIIPLRALLNLQTGLGRAIKNMALAYAPQGIFLPMLVVTGLYMLDTVQNGITITSALYVVMGCYILVIGGQLSAFLSNISDRIKGVRARFRNRKWVRVSLPLMLVSGFLVVIDRSDVILVGTMIGAEEAGIYYAASRTATLVGFILSAVNGIAAPTIASLYSENRHDALQKLAKKIAQLVFWPSLLISLALIAGAGVILSFFGNEFTEGRSVLTILVIGQLINASVGSVGYFMNMTGNQDKSVKVFGVSAIINIILNVAGIHLFGMAGAAMATAISMIIWNLWLYLLVKNLLQIDSSIFSTFKGP